MTQSGLNLLDSVAEVIPLARPAGYAGHDVQRCFRYFRRLSFCNLYFGQWRLGWLLFGRWLLLLLLRRLLNLSHFIFVGRAIDCSVFRAASVKVLYAVCVAL